MGSEEVFDALRARGFCRMLVPSALGGSELPLPTVYRVIEDLPAIDGPVGCIAVHGYAGAIIMFVVLGFIPGWVLAKILQAIGILRVPWQVELAGLDIREEEHERIDREAFEHEERLAAIAQAGSGQGSSSDVTAILKHRKRITADELGLSAPQTGK